MPVPGVEGSSLIGKAPDVNRPHDSNQQQNLAAQAAQEEEAARRADRRRRRAQAARQPDRMKVSDDDDRRERHERPAPRYRPDAEVNGDQDTSEHEIDTCA